MAENTAIEWCDHTFNPWEGCQKVGPGCDHCYAETRNARFGGGMAINWGPGAPRRRTSPANWQQPLRWNAQAGREGRRFRVFCASLADVFDNQVPDEWRSDLFALIHDTPHLDWLLLTKRIGNAADMMRDALGSRWRDLGSAPLPNVWLGATVVNQAEADRDVPKLLQVPARVRFLSIEPMLGAVWLNKWLRPGCTRHGLSQEPDGKCEVCEGRGIWSIGEPLAEHEKAPLHPGLHWVICGGESGPGARPMQPIWAQSLRDQCAAAGVPFLFKQWGEHLGAMQDGNPDAAEQVINATDDPLRIGKKAAGRLLDGRTHDGFPSAPTKEGG